MTKEQILLFLESSPTIQLLKSTAKSLNLRVKKRMKKNEVIKLLLEYANNLQKAQISSSQSEITSTTAEAATTRNQRLPESYYKDKLMLMPVNPNWVHAYWDFSEATLQTLEKRKVVIRIHDVTYIIFDGQNSHRTFEIYIDPKWKKYYFNVPSANADYLAEIGYKDENGSFVVLMKSNVCRTPANSPSLSSRQRWLIRGKRQVVTIGDFPMKPVEKLVGSSENISSLMYCWHFGERERR